MAESKTILILGGGVGGVATARALRKRLPTKHRIVLVDRERDHVFAPSLLWLMVGQRSADAITRPLARLARRGIDVRIGNVEHIDPGASGDDSRRRSEATHVCQRHRGRF